MLCFSAKFVGEKEIFSASKLDGVTNMRDYAWDLISEADVLMHYNGTRFDMPHLNREFVLAFMDPPSPYRNIDLLKAVKKQFKFPSNKLEYVAQALGIGHKVKNEGFDLWKKCMDDDEKAWERMIKYNKMDVLLVERVYERILPWIPSLPSIAAFNSVDGCPACGSTKFHKDGHAYTQQGKYQRYQCDKCNKWFRDTHSDTLVHTREVANG